MKLSDIKFNKSNGRFEVKCWACWRVRGHRTKVRLLRMMKRKWDLKRGGCCDRCSRGWNLEKTKPQH